MTFPETESILKGNPPCQRQKFGWGKKKKEKETCNQIRIVDLLKSQLLMMMKKKNFDDWLRHNIKYIMKNL